MEDAVRIFLVELIGDRLLGRFVKMDRKYGYCVLPCYGECYIVSKSKQLAYFDHGQYEHSSENTCLEVAFEYNIASPSNGDYT